MIDAPSNLGLDEVSREISGLDPNTHYQVWVTASTRVGEGSKSRIITVSPGLPG